MSTWPEELLERVPEDGRVFGIRKFRVEAEGRTSYSCPLVFGSHLQGKVAHSLRHLLSFN